MSKLLAVEADGQCTLDGQFKAKAKGTKILISGHGRIFEEYAAKLRDLEKQGKIVIAENGNSTKEEK